MDKKPTKGRMPDVNQVSPRKALAMGLKPKITHPPKKNI